MRVFAACRLGPRTAVELEQALVPFRARNSGRHFRWIAPENYHLTLRFFGEISSGAATTIGAMIENVAHTEDPFECRASTFVSLPNARRPSVIALSVESGGRLERLADSCNHAFAASFGAPDRPFRAHMTVIRCQRNSRLDAFDPTFIFPFTVSRVGLYESTHGAGGVRYTALCEFDLAADSTVQNYV